MTLSEAIQSYCDSKKIRSAVKRIIVADELLLSGEFLDGDTLWRSLRTNGIKISPATVYDALNWLVNAGFAERRNSGSDRKNLFGIKDQFRTEV
jgi:Fe2+ or Zn2+ uptake regulation protein